MKYTLIKTCSYAMMHMSISIIIAYILSGSLKVALAIGLIEPVAQVAAYFVHESAWSKILSGDKVKHFYPCCCNLETYKDQDVAINSQSETSTKTPSGNLVNKTL